MADKGKPYCFARLALLLERREKIAAIRALLRDGKYFRAISLLAQFIALHPGRNTYTLTACLVAALEGLRPGPTPKRILDFYDKLDQEALLAVFSSLGVTHLLGGELCQALFNVMPEQPEREDIVTLAEFLAMPHPLVRAMCSDPVYAQDILGYAVKMLPTTQAGLSQKRAQALPQDGRYTQSFIVRHLHSLLALSN